MDTRNHWTCLEVIIPLYNEEEMIESLLKALRETFTPEAIAAAQLSGVRFVMVDDGSTDRTAELLAEEIAKGFPATLYRFSRNFGHQNALSAGLANSSAELAAVIDADLQDPPGLILDMVRKWREGFDVVYGQRRKRKENWLKRFCYWSFYRLIGALADISIPLDSGDFCLMDKRVVAALNNLPENQRFIRGMRAWVGFHQTGLEYERPQRYMGKTKYSFSKLYRLATDGVASSSIRPLKVAQVFGFSYAVLSAFLFVLILLNPFLGDTYRLPPLILIISLLILSGNGVLCLCLYILGAYVGRSFLEIKQRPPYIIMETIPSPAGSSICQCDDANGALSQASE